MPGKHSFGQNMPASQNLSFYTSPKAHQNILNFYKENFYIVYLFVCLFTYLVIYSIFKLTDHEENFDPLMTYFAFCLE